MDIDSSDSHNHGKKDGDDNEDDNGSVLMTESPASCMDVSETAETSSDADVNPSNDSGDSEHTRMDPSVASASDDSSSSPPCHADDWTKRLDPRFFLADPVTPAELEAVVPVVQQNLERALAQLEQETDVKAFWQAHEEREKAKRMSAAEQTPTLTEQALLEEAIIKGDARPYQAALVECAKHRNIIVHLGTGTGKTLIALLLIQHLAADLEQPWPDSKQTVFVVPSVPLALQQTTVLRANLALSVATACSDKVKTEAARKKIAQSQVIVATHGALLALLQHYRDLFSMERFNLLIVDECHHCAGNSPVVAIMKYYHEEEPGSRPRVLGLTASPLINVKKHQTNDDLQKQLDFLERTMDAKIVSLRQLGFDPKSPLLLKEAEETTIPYDNTHGQGHAPYPLPLLPEDKVLSVRINELKQLQVVYQDLGLIATAQTAAWIKSHLQPNEFEKESQEQFDAAIGYLDTVAEFCKEQCANVPSGITPKLEALEKLLYEQLSDRPDAVGIVFVKQRITAFALNEYFQKQREPWVKISDATAVRNIDHKCVGQFEDAEPVEDPYHGIQIRFEHQASENKNAAGTSVTLSRNCSGGGSANHQLLIHGQEESCSHAAGMESDQKIPCLAPGQFDDAEMDSHDETELQIHTLKAGERTCRNKRPLALGHFDDAEMNSLTNGTETDHKKRPSIHDEFDIAKMDTLSDVAQHMTHFNAEDGVCHKMQVFANGQFDDAETDSQSDATHQIQVLAAGMGDDPKKQSFDSCELDVAKLQTPVIAGETELPFLQTKPVKNLSIIDNQSPMTYRLCGNPVRCGVLVRKRTRENRYLHMCDLTKEQEEKLHLEWVKEKESIRAVLNCLRRGEINVLLATSVVEEGVDVRACSFVAAFDAFSNMKSYVQMKGRARQEDARFYVFDGLNKSEKGYLSLNDAQKIEQRINDFLADRCNFSAKFVPVNLSEPAFIHSAEIQAIEQGFYATKSGEVSLNGAKSLLYRYALAQPIDPFARLHRETLSAYLPLFDLNSHQLHLPTHIGTRSLRVITLPSQYLDRNKCTRQMILSLMACVRLHQNGLLSERLLPITNEMLARVVALSPENETATLPEMYRNGTKSTAEDAVIPVFVHRIMQDSVELGKFRDSLLGQCIDLAIVTTSEIPDLLPFKQSHLDFGDTIIKLSPGRKIFCTENEMALLSEFFTLIFNARWQKKARGISYCFRAKSDIDNAIIIYRLGIVDENCNLLWDYLTALLVESKQDRKDRMCTLSTETKTAPQKPRLWCPLYDEYNTYISFGPSGKTCDADLPQHILVKKSQSVRTFRDYYREKWNFDVPPDGELFVAQPLWHRPSRRPRSDRTKSVQKFEDDSYAELYNLCVGLRVVELPCDACFEPPLADPAILLLCTLLPQFLFYIERFLTAEAFISHCLQHTPTLGQILSELPLIDVVTVLSSKSCEENVSYERFEWLGDAVLKLVQTDIIIKSTSLRDRIQNLHEGYLDAMRSTMGSNSRLTSACQRLAIDEFILVKSLQRGWTPSPMELLSNKKGSTCKQKAEGKTCADVIEALLGITYLCKGYAVCLTVAEELQLTIPWIQDAAYGSDEASRSCFHAQNLDLVLEQVAGYRFAKRSILLEAFTHPTSLDPETSSYQRLEWIGDAVLCLAAREWIFHEFPDESIGRCVLMESSLCCNQTLAYISLLSELYKHVIHGDTTLPGRIEAYSSAVNNQGRGLWGSDPPKAMADVVESMLGAIHVDGGFCNGQSAARRVIAPVAALLKTCRDEQDAVLLYPKRSTMELGGNLLALSNVEEAQVAKMASDSNLWRGDNWGKASCSSRKAIASISCLGVDLVSVVDESATAASNQACAFLLITLTKNKDLMVRFQEARAKVMRVRSAHSLNVGLDF